VMYLLKEGTGTDDRDWQSHAGYSLISVRGAMVGEVGNQFG